MAVSTSLVVAIYGSTCRFVTMDISSMAAISIGSAIARCRILALYGSSSNGIHWYFFSSDTLTRLRTSFGITTPDRRTTFSPSCIWSARTIISSVIMPLSTSTSPIFLPVPFWSSSAFFNWSSVIICCLIRISPRRILSRLRAILSSSFSHFFSHFYTYHYYIHAKSTCQFNL